jgi:mediator of RNA polymerase II transcription subunit 23
MILDVVLESSYFIPHQEFPDWVNAIGLLIANLPEAYWEGLYQRLATALASAPLSQWTLLQSPFRVFNIEEVNECREPNSLSLLLALSHSVFHHSGFSQIQTLPDLVMEKFLPIMKTEEQLLFVFHLAGPFLQRLHSERYIVYRGTFCAYVVVVCMYTLRM